MKVVIRNAKKSDTSSILSLLYDLGRPEPRNKKEKTVFENEIENYISDPTKMILVAESNSKITGIVSIIFLRRLNFSRLEMYIPELVVKNEFRHLGIGKKLIEHCIRIGKTKKCYRIRLESGKQRKESHIFYKELGFDKHGFSFNKSLL